MKIQQLSKQVLLWFFPGLLFIGIAQKSLANPPGMVLVPAGEFRAGSGDYNDERPVHTVYLDAFYIDVHEVVQKDFERVMGAVRRTSKIRTSRSSG